MLRPSASTKSSARASMASASLQQHAAALRRRGVPPAVEGGGGRLAGQVDVLRAGQRRFGVGLAGARVDHRRGAAVLGLDRRPVHEVVQPFGHGCTPPASVASNDRAIMAQSRPPCQGILCIRAGHIARIRRCGRAIRERRAIRDGGGTGPRPAEQADHRAAPGGRPAVLRRHRPGRGLSEAATRQRVQRLLDERRHPDRGRHRRRRRRLPPHGPARHQGRRRHPLGGRQARRRSTRPSTW